MEVDSEGLPMTVANDGDDDCDALPSALVSHHHEGGDDGEFPMPERSTSPTQHVRANRQRKGGDKMRQGWTASRKQPGGRVPGIVPNLMRSPMAPSTPEAAAGLQGGGQGERPSGHEEEEEEEEEDNRGEPEPIRQRDPEPQAQQQQQQQKEEGEEEEGEGESAKDGEMAAEGRERPWRKPEGTSRAILSVAADDAPLGSLGSLAAAAAKQQQQQQHASSSRPFSSRHRLHLGAAGLSPGGVDAETGAGVSLEEAWRRAREDAAQSFRDCESILAGGNGSQKAPAEQQIAVPEADNENNERDEVVDTNENESEEEEEEEEEVKHTNEEEEGEEVMDNNENEREVEEEEEVKHTNEEEEEVKDSNENESEEEEEEEAPGGAAYESDCSTVSTASGLRSLDSWAGDGGGSVVSDAMPPRSRGGSFSRQQKQQKEDEQEEEEEEKEDEQEEEEEGCRPAPAPAASDSSPSDLREDADEAQPASKVPRLRMMELSQEGGKPGNEEEEQEGVGEGKGEEGPPRGLVLPRLSVPSPEGSWGAQGQEPEGLSTPSPHGPDLSAYAGLGLDGSQRRGSMDTGTCEGLEATLHPGDIIQGLLPKPEEEEEEEEEDRGCWGRSGSPVQPPRPRAPLPGVRAEPPLPMLEPESSHGGMSSSAFHSSESEEEEEEEGGGDSGAMDWLPPQSPLQARQHQQLQQEEAEAAPPREAPLLRQHRSWRISVQCPMKQLHGGSGGEGGEEAQRGGGSREGAEGSIISPSTSADCESSPEAQLPARGLVVLPGAPRPEGEEEEEEGGERGEPMSLGLYHRSLVQGVHELIAGTVAELKISTQAEVARVLGDVAQVSSAMRAAIQDRKRHEEEERQREAAAAYGYNEGSLLESITSVLQEELESRGLSAEGVAEAARAAVSEPLRLFAKELQQGNGQQQRQQQLRPALDEEVAVLRGGVEAAGRELREAAKELQLLRRSQGDQQRQEQQLEAVLEGMASREDRIRDAVDLRLQETAAALRGLQETVAELRESISDPQKGEVGAREAPRVNAAAPQAMRFAMEQPGRESCLCRPSLSVERGVDRASELLGGSAEILGSADAPVRGAGSPAGGGPLAPVLGGSEGSAAEDQGQRILLLRDSADLVPYAGASLADKTALESASGSEEDGIDLQRSLERRKERLRADDADEEDDDDDIDLRKSLEKRKERLKADDDGDDEEEDDDNDVDLRKSLERRKERLNESSRRISTPGSEEDIDPRKSLERRKERLNEASRRISASGSEEDIDPKKSLQKRKERLNEASRRISASGSEEDIDPKKSLQKRKERLDGPPRRITASGSEEDIDLKKSLERRRERFEAHEDYCDDDEEEIDMRKSLERRKERLDGPPRRITASGSEEDIDLKKSLERRRERLEVDDDDDGDNDDDEEEEQGFWEDSARKPVGAQQPSYSKGFATAAAGTDDSDSESGLSPSLRKKAARMRGSEVMPPSRPAREVTAAEGRGPSRHHADETAPSSSDEDDELLSIGLSGGLRRRASAFRGSSNVPTPASSARPCAASSEEDDSSSDDEDVSASLRRKASRLQQRQMAEEAGSSGSDEDEDDFELSAAGRLQRTRWRTPVPA